MLKSGNTLANDYLKTIYLWAAVALLSMAAPCAQAQNECSSALPISVGDDISVTASGAYWYSVDLQADKMYEISVKDGIALLYTSCNGYVLAGAEDFGTPTADIYTPTAAGTYYIEAYVLTAEGKFKIAEVTDNRVCANAEELTLNTESPALPPGNWRWYKVNLVAGKSYAINWRNSNFGDFEVYTTCEGSRVYDNRGLYEITTAGTYYIRAYSYDADNKFKIVEITDNRSCTNAEYISLNTESPALPQRSTYYWYKVNLAAGKSYAFEWINSDSGNFEVYTTCGGSRIYSNRGFYEITTAGTYYIRAYSYGADNKFKIVEITDNRVCANATRLTLNAESPALPPYSGRWYKVNLAAGKSYAINWRNSNSGDFEVYTTCGGSRVYDYDGSGGSTYEITTAGTYYISAYSYNTYGKFKVSEVKDNRVCTYATPLALGAESPTLSQQYIHYWYKVDLATGKAYTIEWQNSGDGYFDVYDACEGNPIFSNNSIYEITTAGTYYINAFAYNTDGKFKVSEVKDNRACTYAEVLALDAESPTLTQRSTNYWYKVDLAAGKAYAIEWQNSGNGNFEVYDACGGKPIYSNGSSTYDITTAGTYYISAYTYNADGKFKVSEIKDNRACTYAEVLALGAESPTLPQRDIYYWYKVDMVAGKVYAIEWQNSGGGNFEVYDACGGSRIYKNSGFYDITTAGTYYICTYAYHADDTFKVSEVTDNRVCRYAEVLALGAESPTLPQWYNDYWYKVNLTAGKSYVIEKTDGAGSGSLYDACGGSAGSAVTSTGDYSPYTVTESGMFYLRLSGYDGDYKVKVSEITDNRVCSNATPIALDQEVTISARSTWYTIDFVAGRTYNIEWSGDGGYVGFYGACNGTELRSVNNSDNNSDNYVAPISGTYYIRVLAYYPARASFTITQTDDAVITDNRICTYAQQVALDETITPPATYTDYWYKIDLQAGKGYKFKGKADGEGVFSLHNACGSAMLTSGNLWQTGDLSELYLAEATGTYYVKVRAYQDGSTLKISEVTTTDIPHTPIAEQGTLQIYPNPTDGTVHIVNNVDDAEVLVYTVNGRLLQRLHADIIDLSGYPAGIYLLRVGKTTLKVIKQ